MRSGRCCGIWEQSPSANNPTRWSYFGRSWSLPRVSRDYLTPSSSSQRPKDTIFKEMHVDGGTTLEVLAMPLKLVAAGRLDAARRTPGQLYIIINNNLDPAFAMTKPKTLSITARAFNTLTKSDIYETILDSYLFAGKQ